MNETHRNALRFLWFEDPFVDNPVIMVIRFCVVLFGLNCAPFLLNATIRYHLNKYISKYPEQIQKMIRSFYVDDFAGGCDSSTEAYELFRLLEDIMREGGFPVHKFLTNDKNLRNLVDKRLDESTNETKVLGIIWSTENDTIRITFEDVMKSSTTVFTKRQILSTLAKLFDPLGLVAPIVLLAKLILQKSWNFKNLGWDDTLPAEIAQWKTWSESLLKMKYYEVPRCYFSEIVIQYDLIGFCDASTKAFAAVIYLRAKLESGLIKSTFVTCKTRVASVNNQHTVPRLELLSCYILCTLMATVERALQEDIEINQKYYWTDSTINLNRIRNSKNEYKQFVENRLRKIRGNSDPKSWSYVPTDMNPADLPSRGCLAHELPEHKFWNIGPEFIRNPEIDQMEFEKKLNPFSNVDIEIKGAGKLENSVHESSMIQNEVKEVDEDNELRNINYVNLNNIINVSRFSNIDKLLRVTAYVLRFVHCSEAPGKELTVQEINLARNKWIQTEQLSQKKTNPKEFSKTKNNIGLYVDDDGLL